MNTFKSEKIKEIKKIILICVVTIIVMNTLACASNTEKNSGNDIKKGSGSIVATEDTNERKAWGPERNTFTQSKQPAYVTFNSMTDNSTIGDERNFVRMKKYRSDAKYSDSVDLEVGEEYEVAIWFDNNANPELNGKSIDGIGVAENTRVRIEVPGKLNGGHAAEIKGIISSTNAEPLEVWDTAYAHSDTTVLLRYVPNSAVIHSNGDINGQVLSSDAMFGNDGAKIGYWNNAWGTLPGGNDYSGYVTFRFKVDQAGFTLSSTVTKENQTNYSERLTVHPGDIISFSILYKNTGTINQKSIIAYDVLPEGLTYIEGTSYFTTSFNEKGNTVSDKIIHGGINLGDFEPGDWGLLTYKVKVEDDGKHFNESTTVVYNNASIATANGTGYDKVEITVKRD